MTIILAITEIREDLIGLCEDDDVIMKHTINNYFDEYEKRLLPVSEEEKEDRKNDN